MNVVTLTASQAVLMNEQYKYIYNIYDIVGIARCFWYE